MNSEEKNAYMQRYREAHREKAIATSKQWRDDCKAQGLCTICKKPARPGKVTCADCAAKSKIYQASHREEKKEYHKNYYSIHRDEIALKTITDVYRITAEEYIALFIKQDRKCAICGKDQSELKRRLCVDHDHETGRVRGLLCHECNLGLGRFQDNAFLLLQAANYMKENSL